MTETDRAAIRAEPAVPLRWVGDVARAPLGSLNAVLGALFVLWGVNISAFRFVDNSFATHLATGRLILADGIPTTDPYSFTAAGETWTVQSWLPAMLYAAIERVGGSEAIHLLAAALTGILAWTAWSLSRPACSALPRVAIVGMVCAVGTIVWSPRPLLFGLVGMSLVVLASERALDPRWLVPVFWVWANSHGSYPLGLVYLVVVLVGVWFDKGDPAHELEVLKWAAIGFVVSAIGPLGPKIFLFPLDLLSRGDVLSNVTEWQAPAFESTWQRVFLVALAVTLVAVRRRPAWRDVLPAAVFLCAALLAARNIPVAMIVITPVLARGLADIGTIRGGEERPPFRIVAGAFVALAVLLGLFSANLGWDLRGYPVHAMVHLEGLGLGPGAARIAHEDTTGNYLEVVYGDEAAVFMDDRFDMYPIEHFEDYLQLEFGGERWEEVLDAWEIQVVVWDHDATLSRLLAADDDWRTIYGSEDWTVHCHRERC